MLPQLPQELMDGTVVLAMVVIRLGVPIGILLALGYWLQRRLGAGDSEATPAVERGPAWLKRLGREINALPAWLPTIVLLMVIGMGAMIYRLWVGLGVSTNLNQAYPWGLWIGFDLFLVAFSGGAFTLATLVYVFGLHQFHAAIRPTVLTGLLGYMAVLIILLMDLGRWDRFYHFLIYPNINSALFEVSWCIFLYSIVLISEFSPVILQRFRWQRALNVVKRTTIVLAIMGATLSSLHQSSLGTLFVIMTERVHPLWYTPLIPLFFFVSSVAAGLAMVVAGGTVSYWVFKRSLPQSLVAGLARFIPWVMGFYAVVRIAELVYSGDILLLRYQNFYSVLYLIEFVVLVVAPIILFAMKTVRESRGLSFFAAAVLLGGLFLNRFDVAWFALKPIPGYTYFPSVSEILIQAGVLSGIILVYTLVGHYFPLFEGLYVTEEKPAMAQDALQPAHA